MNLLKSHKAHQKKCYGAFLKTLLFGVQRSKESSPGDRSHHPAIEVITRRRKVITRRRKVITRRRKVITRLVRVIQK
jgi:hypothetical protein